MISICTLPLLVRTQYPCQRRGQDSKVYRDDCVEIFASPDFGNPQNYFNLEMNALGEQLDQYHPKGKLIGSGIQKGSRLRRKFRGR